MCCWLYLASRTTRQRFCGKPGHQYCPEHQQLIDHLQQLDDDWRGIEATYLAVYEKSTESAVPLCAVCNRWPALLRNSGIVRSRGQFFAAMQSVTLISRGGGKL
jgi:hypothetical protein